MLAFVDLDERVPASHPLRVIKQFAEAALAELSPVFDQMYAAGGRPSIPPERLLKASLLISLYSVRSERAFCEELDFHLLYRWFLDMSATRFAEITNGMIPRSSEGTRDRVGTSPTLDNLLSDVGCGA